MRHDVCATTEHGPTSDRRPATRATFAATLAATLLSPPLALGPTPPPTAGPFRVLQYGVTRSPALLRIECHFGRRLPRKSLPEQPGGGPLSQGGLASWPREDPRHAAWPTMGHGGWVGNPPQQMQSASMDRVVAQDGPWMQQEMFMLQASSRACAPSPLA